MIAEHEFRLEYFCRQKVLNFRATISQAGSFWQPKGPNA